MEKKDVMVDLKINRRESGFCNKDLAHLLDISSSRVARLQTGNALLTVPEAVGFSLIYGKNIDQLLGGVTKRIAVDLKIRLSNMPAEPQDWPVRSKRLDTLNALTARIFQLTKPVYGA